ncbi:MAG TPA: tetratricopeptide repeat protein [Thermoanaerobaculia bacterium]|nr:tetratricopeptide repeat protein [Thermoanaerobaculia bacterium]
MHCAKQGRNRFWIWLLLIGGMLAVMAYVIVECLPDWSEMKRRFTGPARRRRIAMLRAMIRDNPSAGNYEQLGELLVQQKKWSEAYDAFDRAIASRTDLLDTFYWRGVSAFEVGDDAAAIRDLQYVVEREPKYDYSRARCLLARSLARTGRANEAMTVFDRLVESSTASESLVHAAQFYAANGRAADARELVESILARRQTMPAYQKRRDRAAFRTAKKLLRKLRREPAPAAAQQSMLHTQ